MNEHQLIVGGCSWVQISKFSSLANSAHQVCQLGICSAGAGLQVELQGDWLQVDLQGSLLARSTYQQALPRIQAQRRVSLPKKVASCWPCCWPGWKPVLLAACFPDCSRLLWVYSCACVVACCRASFGGSAFQWTSSSAGAAWAAGRLQGESVGGLVTEDILP